MDREPAPRRLRPRRVLSIAGALAPAALTLVLAWGGARAGETQWWVCDQPQDYARAEARGVVVHPDGTLELGVRSESFSAESLGVIWAIAPLRDGSVALGGDHGRIARWTAGAGVRPWARLPAGQVLCLAADGTGVLAGTGPEGQVWRIGARGDTALLARTGERYVWGLAPGPDGSWYVATGTRGRLLRLEGGRTRVVLDTDESNLSSILADGHGGVWAGGDSKGRVFHLSAEGAARTVFDASEDEVRSLALGPDGALYVAALSASAVAEEDKEAPEGPTPARSAVSGGRSTVYRVVPDSAVIAWWSSPQPFVYALAGSRAGLIAATGNRAGVFRIERANGGAQLLAPSQGQVTALALAADGAVWAGTSNGAALWRLGPASAAHGELLSPLLDARRIARFGRVRVRGERGGAAVVVRTRSGNSDPPDTTWSGWSGGAVPEDGLRVSSPAARYLQWKLELEGGRPRIESVEASWREENLPPRVEEVTVAPQAQGFASGEAQPRVEPVTQTLPGGQKVEYSLPAAQTPRQLRELPMFARGLRTITWKASDPNGDALRYRVDVRREGQNAWVKLGADLDAAAFTWDTNALPDGRYRVRVVASDATSNPIGEERSDEMTSAPFTVDNTPPTVEALDVRVAPRAVLIEGRARDAQSTLTRIEASLDDGDWRAITPEGGFADQPELAFRGRLAEVEPGEHVVAVRAVDAAGNSAVRSTHVNLPRAR